MLTVKPHTRTHIRWMIRRDLPTVLAIERAAFGPTAWSETEFLQCLRIRNCIGMVAEDCRGEVVGFMVYCLHGDHLEVINFAVDAGHRRQGVGSQMADKLVSKLSGHRRTAVTLVTRESNLASKLFWKACGFRCEGVASGWYEATGEDGYEFAYRLRPGQLEIPE